MTHTPSVDYTNSALSYTSPESRDTCGFCGGEEGGYAKQDSNGKWKPACWKCVKPAQSSAPQKRNPVGSTVEPDLDVEEKQTEKKKAKGLAPSTYRPRTQ